MLDVKWHTTIEMFVTFWSYSSHDYHMISANWSWCGHDVVIHIWPHYHDATKKTEIPIWPTIWAGMSHFFCLYDHQFGRIHMSKSICDHHMTNVLSPICPNHHLTIIWPPRGQPYGRFPEHAFVQQYDQRNGYDKQCVQIQSKRFIYSFYYILSNVISFII